MPELDEWGNPIEGHDEEGLKNLREAKKDSDRRAKDAEKELEEIRAQMAQSQAQAREAMVAEVLKSKNLPEKLAKVYPGDLDASEDQIMEWAEADLGLTPPPAVQENEDVWDRYDAFVRGSFATSNEDALQGLTDRALQGVMSALGPATSESIRQNSYKPTAEELKDAKAVTDAVNALHSEYEAQVSRGKAEPFQGGFGGRFNPPFHANRALQAIKAMRG